MMLTPGYVETDPQEDQPLWVAPNVKRLLDIRNPTTTPVPAGEPQRRPEDLQADNAVAVKVMRQQGVSVDDLFAFIALQFDKCELKPLNVHFKPEGYALLARQVAAAIQAAMDSKP